MIDWDNNVNIVKRKGNFVKVSRLVKKDKESYNKPGTNRTGNR